jgi:aminopeptidase N
MILRIASVILFTAIRLWAVPPAGIPRGLAQQRAAEISDVHYRVSFELAARATETRGHEELQFILKAPAAVLLDYRDGTLKSVTVNGASVAAIANSGHIELPADKLRAGENSVILQFSSAIAAAGKPITRYEDRDDNTEYLYTLFVPMDASMAFPCFDQPDLKGRFRLAITAPESWTVISNTSVESAEPAGAGQRRTVFGETRPISTYLFAFAAGPFRKIEKAGLPGLYVRQPSRRSPP